MAYTRYRRLNPDGSGRFPTQGALEPPKPTRSQSVLEYALFAVFGLLIVLAGVAIYSTYSPKHKIVPNFVDAGLKQDRVNILVIGVGGTNHPGGGKDLADTMILVSLKPSTRQAAVVSIPRDLWVKVPRYGTHRLNNVHALGNSGGYPGEGPGLLCDTVSAIFGQKVHGFARIDFNAFEKVIDDLGGVDVYVQRSFYDYLFKDGFKQGWHHMDGKRALQYTRYRYIIGPEGDNFARELRQQQVISALRGKVREINPAAAMRLIQAAGTLSENTDTNITTAQMIALYRRFKDIDQKNVRHVSLKPLTQVFMVTRITDPGEAVRPRTGDYRELQAMAATIFNGQGAITTEDQIQFAATPQAPPPPRAQSMLSKVN